MKLQNAVMKRTNEWSDQADWETDKLRPDVRPYPSMGRTNGQPNTMKKNSMGSHQPGRPARYKVTEPRIVMIMKITNITNN